MDDRTYQVQVMASIKLDNDWNEWAHIGGFTVSVRGERDKDARAALIARGIVDHKREHTVEIEVLNKKSYVYDTHRFEPLTF